MGALREVVTNSKVLIGRKVGQGSYVVVVQSPNRFQESSPTPQLKSINSSALSFLYSPTLTSMHDYWKNHSLD